jgi:Cu(I)/Ag(I) efflux system protein CusF
MKLVLAAAALALATPALAQTAPPKATPGAAAPSAGQPAMVMAEGAGVVKSVNAQTNTVTIEHDPIPALNWPAMTMAFKAAQPDLLTGVSAGQQVKFQLMQMGDGTTLTAIQKK